MTDSTRLKTAIEGRLEHRKLTAAQLSRIGHIRDAAKELGRLTDIHTEPCREQALAFTKLEECLMWAVKAISQEAHPE